MDEKRAAVAGILRLVPAPSELAINDERPLMDLKVVSSKGGTRGGTTPSAEGERPLEVQLRRPHSQRTRTFRGAGYRIRTGDLQLGKLTLYR